MWSAWKPGQGPAPGEQVIDEGNLPPAEAAFDQFAQACAAVGDDGAVHDVMVPGHYRKEKHRKVLTAILPSGNLAPCVRFWTI